MNSQTHKETEFALRATWLSLVGGYTQEEISQKLRISRIKVNRLISYARKKNLIHFFIDGQVSELVDLERKILEKYDLKTCHVCMSTGQNEEINAVGNAGAKILYEILVSGKTKTIGFGNGRTIAAIVSDLPAVNLREGIKFVSLAGSLTRSGSANPFDMIYKICEKTSAEGYFMPAPFFSDSVEDKKVIMEQRILKRVMKIAQNAEILFYGLGNLTDESFICQSNLITDNEFKELKKQKATAEILGKFLDADGNQIDLDINQRSVGLNLDDLKNKTGYIVAGGAGKTDALHAVLSAAIPSGIVIDESLAISLLKRHGSLARQVKEKTNQKTGSGRHVA